MACCLLTAGVWLREVYVGWYRLVLQSQDRLYETGEA